jgi:hypothetical protein
MSARTIRRAAERAAAKIARKSAATLTNVPEPGAGFPSLAQITANRANAQLSTGPVSEEGRAISSQNHTIHGLARHNGDFKILPSEDPNGFEALKAALATEHEPSTETESILVLTMAESHWLANRAQQLQDRCFSPETGEIADQKSFSLYLRYQTTHTRRFHKSFNDLLKLRAEKRKTEIGFEAQRRKEEEHLIKSEQHQMKKNSHYWDVLLKDGKACHQISRNVLQNHAAAEQCPGFEAKLAAEFAKLDLETRSYRVAVTAK